MLLNIEKQVMRGTVRVYFGLKLISKGFLASSLSTCDFSTLYTTLAHDLIKEKLTELIE